MHQIIYHDYVERTEVLGPGKRFVLWLSGCCFECDGCIAQNYHSGSNGKAIDAEKMCQIILDTQGIEGITISGGEPFLQSKALAELLCNIKKNSNISVIIYTGFLLRELKHRTGQVKQFISFDAWDDIEKVLSYTDLLIDGRYIKELDDGRKCVGSSNQIIHNLSDFYNESQIRTYYSTYKRKIEIVVRDGYYLMVGVPDKDQSDAWLKLKEAISHEYLHSGHT